MPGKKLPPLDLSKAEPEPETPRDEESDGSKEAPPTEATPTPTPEVVPSLAPGAIAAEPVEGVELYDCERQCGFTATFDEVCAHEAQCTFVAPTAEPVSPPAATEPPVDEQLYDCEKNCGFRGTFDEVEAHEAICTFVGAPPRPESCRR